jgi:hypothetical protein
MHNIHYVRTYANNAQNACDFVESEIKSWGDENNWRTIIGAINKRGKVLNLNKDRYKPNLKNAKESMNDVFHNGDSYYKESVDKLIAGKELKSHDWWKVKRYAEWKSAKAWSGVKGKFNIWKDTFREWEFDEIGLTDINRLDDIDGNEPFIVFIDMHS